MCWGGGGRREKRERGKKYSLLCIFLCIPTASLPPSCLIPRATISYANWSSPTSFHILAWLDRICSRSISPPPQEEATSLLFSFREHKQSLLLLLLLPPPLHSTFFLPMEHFPSTLPHLLPLPSYILKPRLSLKAQHP